MTVFFTTRDFMTDVDQEPVLSLFATEIPTFASRNGHGKPNYICRPSQLQYHRSRSRIRKHAFRRNAVVLVSSGVDSSQTEAYLIALGFVLQPASEKMTKHATKCGFQFERVFGVEFVRSPSDLLYDSYYGLPVDQETGRVEWEKCVKRVRFPATLRDFLHPNTNKGKDK